MGAAAKLVTPNGSRICHVRAGEKPACRRMLRRPAASGPSKRVVEAVRPAGIGGVPEHVVLAHVEPELEVRVERRERPDRHRHALRGAGRAAGEQLHETTGPADRHRLGTRVVGRVGFEQVREAHTDSAALSRDHDLPRSVGGMSSPGASLPTWSPSATTTRAPLACNRKAMAGGANAVNSGTWTAPRRQIPSSATTRSADLPISVATWSPGSTPRSRECRGETLRSFAQFAVGQVGGA